MLGINEYCEQISSINEYCEQLSLVEYLSTKVNINYENATEIVLKYFGIKKFEDNDKYKAIYGCIYSWCKDNHVMSENDLYPMCNLETYNDLTDASDDFRKVKDKFDTNYYANEICQNELDKVHVKNKVHISDFLDIWYTENMIACLCMAGTIYCWNKSIKKKRKSHN